MKKTLLVLATLLMVASMALAQETRATISGTVTDQTGAAIPNAKVTILEVRTGVKNATTCDATGNYTVPFLPPGEYQIEAEMAGFKSFLRKGVKMESSDHVVIDMQLSVGKVSETVEVTADAPQLETSNASTGQSISTKQVEDFPLNGRNPMMVAQLAIGVIATGNPSLVHPFDNGAASAWSIGGTPSQTAEIMIDGAPNATWDGRMAYAPSQESVQEVKVKAFDTDASYGHTGSGTINKVMKTGTNTFHGSAYEFTQPSALAANNFFNNRNAIPVPATKLNQYGGTAGGPVILPKIYNGKNKLFWFFSWETLKDSQPNTKFLTVPTAAERNGDLSALFAVPGGANCVTGANNAPKTGFNCYQVYNPYSGVSKLDSKGNTFTSRTPFQCDAAGNPLVPNAAGIQAAGIACNKLPSQLLNPVSLAYLKFYPSSTLPGDASGNGYSNFGNSATTDDDYNNQLGRLDWAMSDRSRLAFNVRHNYQLQSKNNYFSNNAHGLASLLTRENWGSTVDEVFTLNPTTVLNARINYTRMIENHPSPTTGFDPTTLGFPSAIASASQSLSMPAIVFGNCGNDTTQATSFDCLGQTGASVLPSQSWGIFADIIKQHRSHAFKFGVDLRQYKLDAQTYGASTGTYTFGGFGTSNGWTQVASNGAPAPFGQDFASFLLGLPSAGSFNLSSRGTYTSNYYAIFVNDDWRVKPNLTINLGLRFDHDSPYSEKLGRTVNGFDFTDPNPLATAAVPVYASKTLAKMPATINGVPVPSSFAVPGGLTFASSGNGSIWNNESHLFSPRVGFAWSPEMFNNKTVIRGGVGLFVQPTTLSNLNPTGGYSSTPTLTQEGFSQTTQFSVPSSLLLPSATLSNPFPSGFVAPPGNTAGLQTFLGQSVDFFNSQARNPYSERWTFGVQQLLGNNLVLEVAYIGNHSVHLPIAFTQLNGIPRKYLSTLPYRDATLNSALTATVPNPFAGLIPTAGGFNGSTIVVRQLLVPFPEFPVSDSTSFSSGVTEHNLNAGSSNFNSLNVRVEKRLSRGLQVVGVYAWSKLIENDSWLNNTDTTPERRISPFDHTQRFVVAANYDLPIGRGKLVNLASRWADSLVGGWQVNGIFTYQTGAPILWMNGSSNNPGDYALCATTTTGGACPSGSEATSLALSTLGFNNRQVDTKSFNTTQFVTATAAQFVFHLRTLPTTFSALRQDGTNNFDASVVKKFSITEHTYFQFRAEAFNVLNHPTFGAPNMQPTNASFGAINTQANRPRQLQLGFRFVF